MRTRVKICGCTSPADVLLAADAGADAIGAILAERSARRVSVADLGALARAVPAGVEAVAVVVDPTDLEAASALAAGFTLQFSGDEPPERCAALCGDAPYYKALHVRPEAPPSAADLAARAARYPGATILVDSRVGERLGGTGVAYEWTLVAALAQMRPVGVSGGLTPGTVAACVRAVRPAAVDVRSGVETADRKDERKVRAFVRAVRETDGQT